MKTFKTVKAAREYAEGKNEITHIVEIVPGMGNMHKFVCTKCNAETLRRALSSKPMPEIKSVVSESADLSAERWSAKVAAINNNVPGLTELRAIISDWNDYHEGFTRMMENEMNDGVNPPARPAKEVADIAKKYPVASAYIKAENWELASHYRKSSAGDKAKKKIGNGEDCEVVIAEMEKTWADHCDAHKWD